LVRRKPASPAFLQLLCLLCLLCLLALAPACAQAQSHVFAQTRPQPQPQRLASVSLLTVDGPIGPAYADYVERGIARAAAAGRALVVLQLDTPGGLDTAMRSTTRAILAAPLPVACFVAPRGARAASAGTYILYACHIAAMAPGTNLGAARPVPVGPAGPGPPDAGKDQAPSTMEAKAINDAAAYIRGLAQLRGRNAEWAGKTATIVFPLPVEMLASLLERGARRAAALA